MILQEICKSCKYFLARLGYFLQDGFYWGFALATINYSMVHARFPLALSQVSLLALTSFGSLALNLINTDGTISLYES